LAFSLKKQKTAAPVPGVKGDGEGSKWAYAYPYARLGLPELLRYVPAFHFPPHRQEILSILGILLSILTTEHRPMKTFGLFLVGWLSFLLFFLFSFTEPLGYRKVTSTE